MSEITEDQLDGPIPEPDLTLRYTVAEKSLRDKFVTEYLIDYNDWQAAIRIGYAKPLAQQICKRFMAEPYVAQQIRLRECAPEETEEDARKRVIAGLQREASYFGIGCSASARVAALAKLASLNGMDLPTKTQQQVTGLNGQPLGAGVFVIPGLLSPEDWEKLAEEQQANLVNSNDDKPNTV